jgi:hypothetical protein
MPVLGNSITGNAGVAGALITLSGASSATTTSAADGTYGFGSLSAGAYVVTPTLAGVTFTPAFANETIVLTNLVANFVAQTTGYAQTTTVTDSFHRADSPNLGPNWTVTTLSNTPIPIVSDQAAGDPGLSEANEMYSGASFPDDQFAAITIGAFGISSEDLVFLRTDITILTGYAGEVSGNDAGVYTASISDQGNGEVQMGVTATLSGAPQPGDILSMQVVGTLVTLFYNGVPIASGTSSTTASGTVAFEIDDTATQTDTTVTLFTAGSVGPSSPTPGAGTNSARVIAAGSLFGVGNVTEVKSPRTAIMGTNLGTKIIG